ncbi:hypothetical protein EDB84DRAFT_1444771 [Lactarius hengduanensis]|nr:hypothetical protein EDB84DRAFT_1444771 [Lactarius hengduanensis]
MPPRRGEADDLRQAPSLVPSCSPSSLQWSVRAPHTTPTPTWTRITTTTPPPPGHSADARLSPGDVDNGGGNDDPTTTTTTATATTSKQGDNGGNGNYDDVTISRAMSQTRIRTDSRTGSRLARTIGSSTFQDIPPRPRTLTLRPMRWQTLDPVRWHTASEETRYIYGAGLIASEPRLPTTTRQPLQGGQNDEDSDNDDDCDHVNGEATTTITISQRRQQQQRRRRSGDDLNDDPHDDKHDYDHNGNGNDDGRTMAAMATTAVVVGQWRESWDTIIISLLLVSK